MQDTGNRADGGITLIEQPDASLVEMWGEINVALRSDASAALANSLKRNLPVVIDTSKVTSVDSTGIAFLVQFYTIGVEEGLSVTLLNPPPGVRDVMKFLGVAAAAGDTRFGGNGAPAIR